MALRLGVLELCVLRGTGNRIIYLLVFVVHIACFCRKNMECGCSPVGLYAQPSSTLARLNPQGKSSSYSCRASDKFQTKVLSLRSRQFIQITHRLSRDYHARTLSFVSSRTSKLTISAESGQQSWDFVRFFKTLYYFNGPPNPFKFVASLIEKLSSATSPESSKEMNTSGVILVTGATGGVGRRVVNILQKKGIPFRVLVRNEEKGRSMLGQDVDLVVGDVTKVNTLSPEYFKGVKKVINTVSVIVGPKEGDTPDRAKYSQGIKFFEPEIKGDSPEKVEFIGMQNLIKAVKDSVGLREGKLLFGLKVWLPWSLAPFPMMSNV